MPLTLLALLFLVLLPRIAAAAPITAATDPDAVDRARTVYGRVVAEAWLIAPTRRYRHFVRGNSTEAGGLRVRLRGGQVLTYLLDRDMVFEDNAPRLADLNGDGNEELVVVQASLREGAALAIFAVGAEQLRLLARTPFIGQRNRWLNPAGIADYDGDGELEIALVQMPHLGKRLELWQLRLGGLQRELSYDDVSNHRLGSRHTETSATADVDGDGVDDLVIPDGGRRALRILSFASGATTEIAKFPLPAPADGPITIERQGAGWDLTVRLETGAAHSLRAPPLLTD